jgi:hypothetical protein
MTKKKLDAEFPNPLSSEDIARIKLEIEEIEAMANPKSFADDVGITESSSARIQDKAGLRHEVARKKAYLARNTPRPFESVAQANYAYKWRNEFRKWEKENKPTKKELDCKPANQQDFERIMRKQVAYMRPEVQMRAQICRNIEARLEAHGGGR